MCVLCSSITTISSCYTLRILNWDLSNSLLNENNTTITASTASKINATLTILMNDLRYFETVADTLRYNTIVGNTAKDKDGNTITTPLAVICSPNHIAVPAVSTVAMYK